jgi:tetratricopeptide (TPR) repeat protein
MRKEARLWCEKANRLLACDKLEEALEAYREALAIEPDLPEAHDGMGNVLYDMGQYRPAVESFARAVQAKPGFPEAYKNMGDALFKLKRYEDALAAYRRAGALHPGDEDIHFNLGVTLSMLARYEEAMVEYDIVLCLLDDEGTSQDAVDAALNRALVLLHLSRFEESIIAFDAVMAARPDCTPAYLNKAEAQLCMFNFEGAIDTLATMPEELHFPSSRAVAAFLRAIAGAAGGGRAGLDDAGELAGAADAAKIEPGYWLFGELEAFLLRARSRLDDPAWQACRLLVDVMEGERPLSALDALPRGTARRDTEP